MRTIKGISVHDYHGENKFIGLVETINDFIPATGHHQSTVTTAKPKKHSGPTFREATEKFLTEFSIILKDQRSEKYIHGQTQRIRAHLIPYFGDMPVSAINGGTVQEYRIHRQTHGHKGIIPSRSSLHAETVGLRMILKTAHRYGWIEAVPDISPPYKTSGKIKHRAWFSPDEYKMLYEATRKKSQTPSRYQELWEDFHDYVLFMANTGLRPDEAGRLEYRDVTIVTDQDSGERLLEIEVRGILALPHELSEGQRLALTKDMALFLVSKYGVAVDAAVHAPQEAKGDDPRNHHAHLLFLTRVVEQDGLGGKTRILDDKEQGPAQIELIRQVWETLANAALQQAGFEAVKIDRRTLEDQGIDRIPQEHVGKVGTHEKTEADDTEEPRKKDEEDEGGETDTGKGKAGTGDSKGQAPSAAKKDSSSPSKEKAAPAKTKAETRLGLNEEIKRLNEQRAAFSPVPLKDQIKELDRLMTRLDGRVQRLKTLSDKTSLPERIARAITSLLHKAKDLLAVRTQDEAKRALSAAERDTKAERQKARYGKTYRTSLHERMAEMRENMEILQTRKVQYQKYKAFVELVERRVDFVRPTLKEPCLPVKMEWKATTTPQAVKTKIVTEAIQKREKIPIEFKPTLKQEALTKNFKAVLTNSVSPLAINHSTKLVKEILKGEDSKRPEKSFTAAATTPLKDNAARAVWHKEVTIKIKSLEQTRAERAPIIIKEPMDSSKVWKVETNERGRAILDRMQADIRERKAAIPAPNLSGFSGRFNHRTKIITEHEAIQKLRTEAKAASTKIPPDMRAEPYGNENSKTTRHESGFSSIFKTAGQSAQEDKSSKMSTAFNRTSRPNIITQKIELRPM